MSAPLQLKSSIASCRASGRIVISFALAVLIIPQIDSCQHIIVVRSGLTPFKELAQKLFRKRHCILNFFVRRITSAISEGINNKIKRLKRMAYGYRDVAYFLLKVHQHCGLLNPRRFD